MENPLTPPLIREFFKRVNGFHCISCKNGYVTFPSNAGAKCLSDHMFRVHSEIYQQVIIFANDLIH